MVLSALNQNPVEGPQSNFQVIESHRTSYKAEVLMIVNSVSLTITSFILLLISGFVSYAILFKPELGDKLIRMGKSRLAPWTMKEGADVYIKVLTLAMTLVFLCMNCFILYGWVSRLSSR